MRWHFFCYHIFMSNVEDLAMHNLDRSEQKGKKDFARGQVDQKIGSTSLGTRKESIKKRFDVLKKEGWGKVWGDRKLRHVAESEEYYSSISDYGDNAKNAEVLEALTNYGVTRLRWLGNFPIKELGGKVDFRAISNSTRTFDDWRHRIDSVATLEVSGRVRSKIGLKSNVVEFGIDATTWKRDNRLPSQEAEEEARLYFAEKISRSNNEKDGFQQPAPFGFSQLDFYVHPRKDETGQYRKDRIKLIPRFVIGVNGEIADSIRQFDFQTDHNGFYQPKSDSVILNDPRIITTQFKIISEINKQSEMLTSMLPNDYASNPEYETAKRKLDTIRYLTNGALRKSAVRVIEVMRNKKILPEEVETELYGKNDTEKAAIISKMFRDSKRRDDGFYYDPTYDGILSAAERFIECSRDENSGSKLRGVQIRNIAVIYEGGKIREIPQNVKL